MTDGIIDYFLNIARWDGINSRWPKSFVYVLDHADAVEADQSVGCEGLIYEELRSQIDGAIETLPKQCRLIFRMSREQDLSYRDIAVKLNISVKTVDTQIGRALKHIRKSIDALN